MPAPDGPTVQLTGILMARSLLAMCRTRSPKYSSLQHRNKHSLLVARVVQFGGMITVAGLGGFMFLMFRRDLKLGREHALTRGDD